MGQSPISMFNDVCYAIEKRRTFTFVVSGWISNVAAWLDRSKDGLFHSQKRSRFQRHPEKQKTHKLMIQSHCST